MLGDIYIASALAIFLAILGWSESIFGLSQRTKEKEAEFIRRAGLTLADYLELKKLTSTYHGLDQGGYTKTLMKIIKNTNIKSGDKNIIERLRNNGSLISSLEKYNFAKKIVVVSLFFYLYISGTVMLLFENALSSDKIVSLNEPVIILQSILFIFTLVGGFIYIKTGSYEKIIQQNLNSLIIQINGDK